MILDVRMKIMLLFNDQQCILKYWGGWITLTKKYLMDTRTAKAGKIRIS